MNVRCSTTLKSERLTDAQCVNRLQTGITKAIIEMITAARYKKGYGRLERYEGKLSRTVLRGLGAGNGLWLLGDFGMGVHGRKKMNESKKNYFIFKTGAHYGKRFGNVLNYDT